MSDKTIEVIAVAVLLGAFMLAGFASCVGINRSHDAVLIERLKHSCKTTSTEGAK